MNRRRFLARIATTIAAAPLPTIGRAAAGTDGGLIDTNVSLFQWPTRRMPADTPALLAAKLRRHGVTSAWAGSFEGVLHTDIAGANGRLAEACVRDGAGLLVPFGTVNPALPDWEDDIRRCHEIHRMPGIRLYPNYHGYKLDDARFAQLVDLTARRGLLVQVALGIEDDRSQNPALESAPVNAAPLAEVIANTPLCRIMVLNGFSRILAGNAAVLRRLVATGRVWFELATLEGVAGIGALLKSVPDVRLTFGSHAPYFYFEAALLKLQESALAADQLDAIRSGHARAALAATHL